MAKGEFVLVGAGSAQVLARLPRVPEVGDTFILEKKQIKIARETGYLLCGLPFRVTGKSIVELGDLKIPQIDIETVSLSL